MFIKLIEKLTNRLDYFRAVLNIKKMELTLVQICIFYGCSLNTARMRVAEIKKALKLPENKKHILAIHVAKYEGLTVSEVREIIKLYQKTSN